MIDCFIKYTIISFIKLSESDVMYLNNQPTSSVKTAAQDIKRMNRRRIYNLLRSGGNYSRRDIVLALGLSLPTVVQNITDMLEEGLVQEVGQQAKTGGRRAMTYASCTRPSSSISVMF